MKKSRFGSKVSLRFEQWNIDSKEVIFWPILKCTNFFRRRFYRDSNPKRRIVSSLFYHCAAVAGQPTVWNKFWKIFSLPMPVVDRFELLNLGSYANFFYHCANMAGQTTLTNKFLHSLKYALPVPKVAGFKPLNWSWANCSTSVLPLVANQLKKINFCPVLRIISLLMPAVTRFKPSIFGPCADCFTIAT